MKLTFWGVRGSIPTPGKSTIEYGGNTTCMEVRSKQGDIYIVDAGSGIRELGNTLMSEFRGKVKANLFITHDHWDHIHGFPFFTPAYVPGCEIKVYSGDKNLAKKIKRGTLEDIASGDTEVFTKEERTNHTKDTFAGQQDVNRGYFPITIDQMGSRLSFNDLKQYELLINGLNVSYMVHSAHPGGMFSYQMSEYGKRIVFAGDYEHDGKDYGNFGENDQSMIAWARNADALVIDAQYTPEEYEKKKGWGHSQIERICELAAAANVEKVYITHHDPVHTDEILKTMETRAQNYMRNTLHSEIPIYFAREGMSVEV
ncbi:MAG: MBL fold metallo-hydrolase [Nanoarchaeota archaeon]